MISHSRADRTMSLVTTPREIGAARERQHIQQRIGSWLRASRCEAKPYRYIDGALSGGEILFCIGHFDAWPTLRTEAQSARHAHQRSAAGRVPKNGFR